MTDAIKPPVTLPAKRCSEILTRRECFITRPCPEGPKVGSYCRWVVRPFRVGKRSIEEHYEHYDDIESTNEIQKRQVITYEDIHPLRSYPLTPFNRGYCSCCVITACDAPMKFNRAICSCQCPRGTRNNGRGQCIGE